MKSSNSSPSSPLNKQIDGILGGLISVVAPDDEGYSFYDDPKEQEEAEDEAREQAKAKIQSLITKAVIDELYELLDNRDNRRDGYNPGIRIRDIKSRIKELESTSPVSKETE